MLTYGKIKYEDSEYYDIYVNDNDVILEIWYEKNCLKIGMTDFGISEEEQSFFDGVIEMEIPNDNGIYYALDKLYNDIIMYNRKDWGEDVDDNNEVFATVYRLGIKVPPYESKDLLVTGNRVSYGVCWLGIIKQDNIYKIGIECAFTRSGHIKIKDDITSKMYPYNLFFMNFFKDLQTRELSKINSNQMQLIKKLSYPGKR